MSEIEQVMKELESEVGCIRKAFEEVEEYRAIGTLDECREAMDKRKPMKPLEVHVHHGTFECPNCGDTVYERYNLKANKFCKNCGQAIDWSDDKKGFNDCFVAGYRKNQEGKQEVRYEY